MRRKSLTSSLSQNPGKKAREHFKPDVWEELVKVVPNFEAKNRMMIFYRKLQSYKARNVTLEQRQRMSGLADDLENYVLNNF